MESVVFSDKEEEGAIAEEYGHINDKEEMEIQGWNISRPGKPVSRKWVALMLDHMVDPWEETKKLPLDQNSSVGI